MSAPHDCRTLEVEADAADQRLREVLVAIEVPNDKLPFVWAAVSSLVKCRVRLAPAHVGTDAR